MTIIFIPAFQSYTNDDSEKKSFILLFMFDRFHQKKWVALFRFSSFLYLPHFFHLLFRRVCCCCSKRAMYTKYFLFIHSQQSSWGETKNFMNQKVLLEKKEEKQKKDCWGHLAPLFLMVSRFPRALVASFYAVSSHFHSVFIFISFRVQRSWRAIIFTLFKYFPFFFFHSE